MNECTNNLNVSDVTPIIGPIQLKQVLPVDDAKATIILGARCAIKDIISNRDDRLLVVVGPCSIHDTNAAMEYAERLAVLSKELSDRLFIVMRVYFEKPRTTVGWKGLINDPDLDGSHNIPKGLGIARRILYDITSLDLPVGTEMLDTVTPEYIADLISWAAIGARTVESQPHRQMSSGLSFPVGFKNGTDGNLQVAIDAMGSAIHPHSFLGIDGNGQSSILTTTGNPDVHIVLRGGGGKPNHHFEDIARVGSMLSDAGLEPSIMVDCSHANSFKDHERQESVLTDVLEQIQGGARSITGVMIESFLEAGNQSVPEDRSQLRYGVSITDKCVSWETTERMLRHAHSVLDGMGGRPIGR